MIEVVDPNDHSKLVDYGETGRVRLTTLTKEFFMPRFLERDEAEREPPCEAYPWDGVRNVRPFRGLRGDASSRACTDAAPARAASRAALPAVDVARVVDFETREPFVEISQANLGLVRRDLLEESQQAMRAALAAFSMRELVALSARAAEHFLTATLPLGEATQTPERVRAPALRHHRAAARDGPQATWRRSARRWSTSSA